MFFKKKRHWDLGRKFFLDLKYEVFYSAGRHQNENFLLFLTKNGQWQSKSCPFCCIFLIKTANKEFSNILGQFASEPRFGGHFGSSFLRLFFFSVFFVFVCVCVLEKKQAFETCFFGCFFGCFFFKNKTSVFFEKKR